MTLAASRLASLASVALLALAPRIACAQSASVPSVLPSSSTKVPPSDEILVTGSRIARSEFAAPNPITSFDAAAIQNSGNVNITDFLLRVPALSASVDRTQTSGYNSVYRDPYGGAGLNELNLRGLGTTRTLVLVDGRRHVAGEANTAAVDINSIPTDLISRVDVLTGGASAVYGADGVSGVVNFILKRDLDGVLARAQNGISERGDAGQRFVSVALGHNFASGRANLTAAYEFNAEDPLANDDRAYLRRDQRKYLVTNPDGTSPTNVLVGDLRYADQSINGAISFDPSYFPVFDGNGQPYVRGRPVSYYYTGGSSVPVAGFVGDILPRTRRHAVNLLGHYDVSEAFKISVEGKYVRSDARTSDQITGDYPDTILPDNPFIPASVRPFVPATGLFVTRINQDYGRHGEDDRRQTYRGVIDVSGRVTGHARYDVYYEYGETDTRITRLNDRLNDRYLAALDAVIDPSTGQPTCRSNINPAAAAGAVTFTPGPNSGCAPLNIFGSGSPSAAAKAFVLYDGVSHSAITQQVANGSLSGDFGALFRLPGGPVQFSLGGEYRRETSRFSPDSYLVRNLYYQFDEYTAAGTIPSSYGAFDVKEAFGELNVPILAHARFAETLSVGAAGRYSNYSTKGGTNSWQFNGVYAPVRDLTIRGSYSKSVRAPNIGELFSPASSLQNFFGDPCDPNNVNLGAPSRAANCTALLTSLGVNPSTFAPLKQGISASTVFGTSTGNPTLSPETARTWTAGVVLRPRWLRGLTASFDWYDITLSGAISLQDPQALAQLCVDQLTINNVFCGGISRARGTGYINGFNVRPENVSQFRTSGADLNLDYLIRTPHTGTIDLRFVGGYLDRAAFINTPGAAVEDRVDQPNRPKFQFNLSPTWTIGQVTLSYNLHWQDRTRRYLKAITDADPNYALAGLLRYSELWQHDVQIEYHVPRYGAIYAGVNNLSGQRPDADASNLPISPVGRFIYVGVKIALASR